MKAAIITGASKGLGASLVKRFINEGTHVMGISRSGNDDLASLLDASGSYEHIRCDLGDIAALHKAILQVQERLSARDFHTIYVVNNAAVLQPIQPAQHIQVADLSYHFQVNAVAPMSLLNAILERYPHKKRTVLGVNITSGAADRAVFGWSAYCSTKASMNRYTQTVALEQAELQTGNKVIAFNPGIMDTDMQAVIRSTSEVAFKDVDTFKAYQTKNMLQNAEQVARILYMILLDSTHLENGKIYSVNDYV